MSDQPRLSHAIVADGDTGHGGLTAVMKLDVHRVRRGRHPL